MSIDAAGLVASKAIVVIALLLLAGPLAYFLPRGYFHIRWTETKKRSSSVSLIATALWAILVVVCSLLSFTFIMLSLSKAGLVQADF